VLALAERERLSGREFLTAYAAGSEILVRLSLAIRARPGWFYSSVLGVFGAAAGAARALRLDAGRTRHAMGVALSRAAGTQQTLFERSLTKRLQSAFAARDGVEAALLAACGVTAPAQMFEGAAGFSALYGEIDAAIALEGLGREFHFTALTMKKYASCYCNHAAIQAALDLVHRHGLRAAEVREAAVRITPFMARLVGAPYDPGDNPQVAAQFSVQYSVANVFLRGRFAVEDILPTAATDPEVCALASRVRVEIDSTQAGKFLPATVRVRTASGAVLEATATQLPGTPLNPMPEAELHAKALACLGTGVQPIQQDAARRFAERIAALDTVTDMREFFSPTLLGDR
jgi:2-methylcitrate dehydratase PrpD